MNLVRFLDGTTLNLDNILMFQETPNGVSVTWSNGERGLYEHNQSIEHSRLINIVLELPVTHLDLSDEDLRTIKALSGKLNDRLPGG